MCTETLSILEIKKLSETADQLYKSFQSLGPESDDQEFQSIISVLENTEERVAFVKSIMSWPSSSTDKKKTMQYQEILEKVRSLEEVVKRNNDPELRLKSFQRKVNWMIEKGSLQNVEFKKWIHFDAIRLSENKEEALS